MATAAELSQLRKDLYNTIRNPVEGKMAGKIISGIMMAAELIDNDGSSGGGVTEQWVLDQGYLTSISGLTAGDADQLGGVDAINYARKDVAVTFNDDVTIGVGAVLSGNGSGLTNLNASNLASGSVPSARLPSTATFDQMNAKLIQLIPQDSEVLGGRIINGSPKVTATTTATTLITDCGAGGSVVYVTRDTGNDRFLDVLLASTVSDPVLLHTYNWFGSPSARTYTRVGGELRIAIASGSLDSISAFQFG